MQDPRFPISKALPQPYRIHKVLSFIYQQLQLLSSLCHEVWRKKEKSVSVGRIPVQKASSNTQRSSASQELLAVVSETRIGPQPFQIARHWYLRKSLISHMLWD